MICKHILLITFLKKPELILFLLFTIGFTKFQTIQLSIITVFCLYMVKCENSSISNNLSLAC